ncbi:GntR family transcriptional regulator [Mechercharimyces sp. CAU 1602]|uniref:GntR family transcriptional regulator n=1 Tax=Mechercharimyces sp. CAU 1602 TaxID=2973933 RepID=UPI0021639C1C|nr:GntR family transcriptional regulator [Mechercharimyces sp. CAU 1602]MCS1352542.1 GntR family transcriptional regulator [Mechercharimyces sp. CAU 1602]
MNGFDGSQPIYLQLAHRIQRQVISGELQPGEKLPSVRELALQVNLNPNTVSQSYKELQREGVVEMRRGQGTFITDDQERLEQLRHQLCSHEMELFFAKMKEMGFEPQEIMHTLSQFIKNQTEEGKNTR